MRAQDQGALFGVTGPQGQCTFRIRISARELLFSAHAPQNHRPRFVQSLSEVIRRLPEKEAREMSKTPEPPDNTPIREIRFPTRIENALFAAGLKTVGEVREMSDAALLALPDFGKTSVAQLRDLLGLPSTDSEARRQEAPRRLVEIGLKVEGNEHEEACRIGRPSLRHECVCSERAAEGRGQAASARKAANSCGLQTRWNG